MGLYWLESETLGKKIQIPIISYKMAQTFKIKTNDLGARDVG